MKSEQEKYKKLWNIPEYRYHTMSDENWGVQYLTALAKPPPGSTVIDFGCGRGRTSKSLAKAGFNVTMIDFAPNCLDEHVKQSMSVWSVYLDRGGGSLGFIQCDLEEPIPVTADCGVCFEVMEHLPPENVYKVLSNIMTAASSVVFTISVVPDLRDHLIGEPIHLTVKPLMWWLEQFDKLGCRIEFVKQSISGFLLHVRRVDE